MNRKISLQLQGITYSVIHIGWDCKDDPKLYIYDDLKLDFLFLHLIEYFYGLWLMMKHRNKPVFDYKEP